MRLEDLLMLSSKYRKIILKNYKTQAYIGAYAHERGVTQAVCFNVEVWVKNEAVEDDLADVFNYDHVVNVIENVLANGHTDLQEVLVQNIVSGLLAFEDVQAVKVRSEKLQAYPKAESVGVEVFQAKD